MLIYIIPVFLFLILLFSAPVTIKIEYCRKGDDDHFQLDVYTFFSFLGFSIRIPYLENRFLSSFTKIFAEIDSYFIKLNNNRNDIDIEKEIEWKDIQSENIEKLFALILDQKLNQILIETLRIRCENFCWTTEFGLSNPALTGITNGFVWIIKGIIIKVTYDFLTYQCTPNLNVKPDFNNKMFSSNFSGIFSIVIGNIILTIIKVIFYKFNEVNLRRFFIQLK